jgi:hypothetical protein
MLMAISNLRLRWSLASNEMPWTGLAVGPEPCGHQVCVPCHRQGARHAENVFPGLRFARAPVATAAAKPLMTVKRTPNTWSLIDVFDRVLDKGIVIDAWARMSLVGIDFLTVEARIVVASFATYLSYANALNYDALAKRSEDDRSLSSRAAMKLCTGHCARRCRTIQALRSSTTAARGLGQRDGVSQIAEYGRTLMVVYDVMDLL